MGRLRVGATPEVTPEVRFVQVLVGEMSRQQLQSALGLKDEEHFRKAYLQPALENGVIEMTIPDKPRSSKQKYRRTRGADAQGTKQRQGALREVPTRQRRDPSSTAV